MNKDQLPTTDPRHKILLPTKSTRSDIILATRKSEGGGGDYKQITIVEIKFCRDTDHQQQLDRALSQHQALRSKLVLTHQCPVNVTPILIGVSGALFTNYTAEALKNLGIKGNPLKTTLNKLHVQAIQTLRSIVSTRRRLEKRTQRARGPAGGQDNSSHPGVCNRPIRSHRDNG